MVGELASRHALPRDVVEGVSERTGGVPLFVEEVTRLLLERGVEGGAQAIPPTLQQSLAARLDRLGEGARSRADRRGFGARFFLCVVEHSRRLRHRRRLRRVADAASTRRRCNPPSNVSRTPISFSSKAPHRWRPIASSMR